MPDEQLRIVSGAVKLLSPAISYLRSQASCETVTAVSELLVSQQVLRGQALQMLLYSMLTMASLSGCSKLSKSTQS